MRLDAHSIVYLGITRHFLQPMLPRPCLRCLHQTGSQCATTAIRIHIPPFDVRNRGRLADRKNKKHFCPALRERTPWSPPALPASGPARGRRAPLALEHGPGRRSTPTAGAGHAPPWGRGGPARGDVGGMARGKLGWRDFKLDCKCSVIRLLPSMPAPSGSVVGSQLQAHREAIQGIIDEKLTNQLTQSIDGLNRSMTRLAKIGLWLTGVGVLLTVVSVVKGCPFTR